MAFLRSRTRRRAPAGVPARVRPVIYARVLHIVARAFGYRPAAVPDLEDPVLQAAMTALQARPPAQQAALLRRLAIRLDNLSGPAGRARIATVAVT